jgi:protein ImuB
VIAALVARPEDTEALVAVARGSSPRVEVAGPGVVVLDARGLRRLFGREARIAALCRQQAAERGAEAVVAMAATRTAALLLALGGAPAVVAAGGEAAAVAGLPIDLLARLVALDGAVSVGGLSVGGASGRGTRRRAAGPPPIVSALDTWRRWGLGTLGALAALPPADLFERMGAAGLGWQAMARGADARPLVPTPDTAPFQATCAFEWPIETIEPLAFALGGVVDPLCARLERDELGTVTLQTTLRLVTRELYVRRLGLPMPMRDPRVLRTLIGLDLESHPPPAGIDAITVTFEPTAGRVVQPSLLARAHPRPEALATLTARLRAVMGDGRVGVPVVVDTHRPGAFAMRPLLVQDAGGDAPDAPAPAEPTAAPDGADTIVAGTLRRFRRPPAVRVEVVRGRPVRVRPIEPHRLPRLGAVRQAAGPWRSSGDWWRWAEPGPVPPPEPTPGPLPEPGALAAELPPGPWDDDEWDVVLESGAVLRLARDRRADAWVVVAVID